MSERIELTEFEEELERQIASASSQEAGRAGDTVTGGIDPETLKGTSTAATVKSGAHITMDVQLTFSDNKDWPREFVQASPAVRAVMLSQIMELFNDGQEGIFISFSEPKIT